MIGDRIKELRKRNGITQEQLAAIIGVERSSIGKYEGKQQIIPSDDVKKRIAEYFNVTLDWLCEVETPKESNDFIISESEKQLIIAYRKSNISIQQTVCDILHVDHESKLKKDGIEISAM